MTTHDPYNETTNTFAGITTPRNREDQAATDPLTDFVEETMDQLQQAFDRGNTESNSAGDTSDITSEAGRTTTGRTDSHEPTIAPGMNTHDPLEQKASKQDIQHHNTTSVTRVYLDRTTED